jgi:predicted nucleic acid-binding protein
VVLVDTSVWVEHFCSVEPTLAGLLEGASVLTHPLVLGELFCGRFNNRRQVFDYLQALPRAQVATHEEVMRFVDERKIFGRGVGWIDMHLLACALLSDCLLFTRDRRLAEIAAELGVKARQSPL